MKLKNILIPLATVATTAAAIVPLTTACGNGRKSLPGGYTNAEAEIDTSKFKKAALPADWTNPETVERYAFEGAGTKDYIDAVKANPQIAQDDYAYHLNEIDSMINLLKDISVKITPVSSTLNDDPTPIEYKSPIKEVKVNAYGGKISDLTFGDAKIIEKMYIEHEELTNVTIYPTSWNKSVILSADITANFDDLYKQIMEQDLGWGECKITIDLEVNFCFSKCPISTYWDPIAWAKKIVDGKVIDIKNIPDPDESLYGLGMGLDFEILRAWKDETRTSELAYTDWEMGANFDANISFKSDYVDFNIGGGKKQNITINSEAMGKSPILALSKYVLVVMDALAGWSTYYFSDYVYEVPTPSI